MVHAQRERQVQYRHVSAPIVEALGEVFWRIVHRAGHRLEKDLADGVERYAELQASDTKEEDRQLPFTRPPAFVFEDQPHDLAQLWRATRLWQECTSSALQTPLTSGPLPRHDDDRYRCERRIRSHARQQLVARHLRHR